MNTGRSETTPDLLTQQLAGRVRVRRPQRMSRIDRQVIWRRQPTRHDRKTDHRIARAKDDPLYPRRFGRSKHGPHAHGVGAHDVVAGAAPDVGSCGEMDHGIDPAASVRHGGRVGHVTDPLRDL
jgi:hypothetical protein